MPVSDHRSQLDAQRGKLTGVILMYNKEKHISNTLAVIAEQLDYYHQIIVLDDASDDCSFEVAQRFASNHPKISVIRNQKNMGIVTNLNKGTKLATGEYVHFLGAEDIVLPGFAKKSIAILEQNPEAAFCCSDVYLIDEQDKILNTRPFLRPARVLGYLNVEQVFQAINSGDNWFSNSSVVYRRQIYTENGGYDDALGSFCDGYFTRMLAFKYGFCYLREPLAAWRCHDNSFSSSAWMDVGKVHAYMQDVVARLGQDIKDRRITQYKIKFYQRWLFDLVRMNVVRPDAIDEAAKITGDKRVAFLAALMKRQNTPLVAQVLAVLLLWPYGLKALILAIFRSLGEGLRRQASPKRLVQGCVEKL